MVLVFERVERISKGGRHGLEGKPWGRITSQDRIKLSAAALRLIGDPDYVDVFYDRSRKMVGLKPITTRKAGAFKVSLEKRPDGSDSGRRMVTAKSLTRDHGVEGPSELVRAEVHDGKLIFRVVDKLNKKGR